MTTRRVASLRNQLGVAMVTVLFVAATLTAVASTAVFMTIDELRAGTDDRKAAEALAHAEAGIDRLLLEMKRGTYSWGKIRLAGCTQVDPDYQVKLSGTIGGDPNRTYETELTVYNPDAAAPSDRLPPNACAGRSENPRVPQYFAITSTGRHPTATRVVRQLVRIKSLQLPIGVYAQRVDANGQGGMTNISLISATDITGREKVGFFGEDPYYTKDDFYGNGDTSAIPAAAHALGAIYFVKGGSSLQEHPPTPNCEANPRGTAGQSLWDGSRGGTDLPPGATCPGWTSAPPRSSFTQEDLKKVTPNPNLSEQDYLALKEAAKSSGLYCTPGTGGNLSCLREGQSVSISGSIDPSDLGNLLNKSHFTAYFDFPSGTDPFSVTNTVKWKAEFKPCSDDPGLNKSSIVIIRNGSLSMQSGSFITGAMLLPEGRFDSEGSYTTHGTVIAKEFWLRGGATLQMDHCWVKNMPGPFLDVATARWSELDR